MIYDDLVHEAEQIASGFRKAFWTPAAKAVVFTNADDFRRHDAVTLP